MPIIHLDESPPASPCADRRGAERYPSGQDASCHPTSALDSTPVLVKDVSIHGVGLVSSRRFEPGTILVLELAESAPSAVNVLARVVRIVPQKDGHWLAGCVFLNEVSEEEFTAFRAERNRTASDGRRAGVRLPAYRLAVCRAVGVGTLGRWTTEVRDASPEGMGLILAVAVEVGVQLRVEMPATGDEPARTELVKVIRREPLPDGKWLLGCQVVSVAPRVPAAPAVTGRRR